MAISKKNVVTMKRSYSCSMPGVWNAVAHNRGALVIYHSPKACGHVTHTMELGSHYRSLARQEMNWQQYNAPLITSNLKEEHSIFGGTEQLRKCIDYVVARYKPEYIVIANSCVAGVIGDDVKSVTTAAQEMWNIPMLSVDSLIGGLLLGSSNEKALLQQKAVPNVLYQNIALPVYDEIILSTRPFMGIRGACHMNERLWNQYISRCQQGI